MKPATITLGAALFLVVGTSSAVILRQHAQIAELRARLDAAATVRASAPVLETAGAMEAAAAGLPAPPGIMELRGPGTEGELAPPGPFPRRRGANRFAELLADPEIAALMMNQRKGELDARYAALFKKLGLNPAEIDALKSLLAEKVLARMETNALARAEGLGGNDPAAMEELVRESDAEVEARMRELLGTDRYAVMQEYEATAQERSSVQQLDLRLSYSQSPLQSYQSEAMVDILEASSEPRASGWNSTAEETASYLSELEAYNAEVYTKAQSVLNGAQLEALQQMQQERLDRARLNSLMRRRGDPGG